MVQGLWDCHVDAIIDINLGDANADINKYKPMTSVLTRWENIKKNKHGNHCNDQWKQKFPFVISVDGMLGMEDLVVLSQLSLAMADKREESLSQVWGWVNKFIAISVVRSYSRMIRSAQLPSPQ